MDSGLNLLGNRYKKVENIGNGSYGTVYKYLDTKTNTHVAIKKIQDIQDVSDAKRVLREIIILKYCNHDNLLELLGFHLEPNPNKFYDVYLITELMDFDMFKVIKKGKEDITPEHIQYIMYQVFLGLYYLHENNIIHRDIKPNNILLNDECDVKICDFGFARELQSGGPERTEYVVTRFYRAPEIMLNSKKYDSRIDMWSLGCTFFELIDGRILFEKAETYIELLGMIIEMLGTPSNETLKFVENQTAIDWIKNQKKCPFSKASSYLKTKDVDENTKDLLDRCLMFDPRERITARQALEHPYFQGLFEPENDLNFLKLEFDFSFEEDKNITMEKLMERLDKEVMDYRNETQ